LQNKIKTSHPNNYTATILPICIRKTVAAYSETNDTLFTLSAPSSRHAAMQVSAKDKQSIQLETSGKTNQITIAKTKLLPTNSMMKSAWCKSPMPNKR
jgi:hypothetical protein